MTKRNGLFFFLFFFFLQLNGQNQEQELSGNVIFRDQCNEQAHPVVDAFDDKMDTYFSSCWQEGNWIGLDLGEKHIITQIAYSPRMDGDYRHRLKLGIFEGANNPDFGDAIPLFIIPDLTERELTKQEVECSRGFRYVRFVFPTPQEGGKSSYLSEIKFYGYKGNGNDSQLPRITNIPTVSIHTVNNQDITSKEIYIKGIISVISADGKNIHTDSLDIRGRGNNSWSYPKKPYRVKLYKKTNLLNLPARAKNWTLINNYGDKTLMRNLIGFDISEKMEMPYTPAGVPVNVFLNGDYKGCYQLCDQVEVNDGRIEVEEMKLTDVTPPKLWGGYLLEIDAYADSEPLWFTSEGNIPVTIKYPDDDEIAPVQKSFIQEHFNYMEKAVKAWNYTDEVRGFRKYIDTPSFLRRFLAAELNGNTDSYWSVYLYKKRDENQFYFAPIWDLDLAFENDERTYPINQRSGNQWIYASTGSTANGMRDLVNRILSDPNLVKEMEEIYAYYRDRNIISEESLLKVVDSYAEELNESQQLNFLRWPILKQKIHANPVIHGSYEAEVENVRNFIKGRIIWMDKKLNYVPNSIDQGAITERLASNNLCIGTEKNTLYIKNVTESISVKIVDVTGKTVVGSTQIKTDYTANLPKGVYFLIIATEAKEPNTYKCIIP